MPDGLLEQLVTLVLTTWGTRHTAEEIRRHLLTVLEAKTYCVLVEKQEVVGYLEWRWVNLARRIVEVTELITTRPGVIWRLRKRFTALPWDTVQFTRYKGHRERQYHRRPAYV